MLKTLAFFALNTIVNRDCLKLTMERMRMYRLLDQPRHVAGKVKVAGKTLQYPDAASCFSAWRYIFDDQCYLFQTDNDRPTILDIGANIGLASLFFHRRYPQSRIVAFEPDSELFKLLRENLNGLERIETRRAAISDTDGEVTFFRSGDDAGSILANSKNRYPEESVPCRKLSTILKEFDRIDLLKLDIEGAEALAIIEASSLLHCVDRLFVEFHSFYDRPQRLSELLSVLEANCFRYFLQSESIQRSPFLDRDRQNGMDGRINIYAVNTAR